MASNENKFDVWLTRELLKTKLRDRYWSDSEFRNAKNEENKKRAREIVCCVGCEKPGVMVLCFHTTKTVGKFTNRLHLRG